MSYAQDNSKRVQQEITVALQKRMRLRIRGLTGRLDEVELEELRGIESELAQLIEDRKYWEREVRRQIASNTQNSREASFQWIESVTGIEYKLRPWNSLLSAIDVFIQPSRVFRKKFEDASKAFHLSKEAGRRVFINAFLSDVVLRREFGGSLRVFPEVSILVQSEGPEGRFLRGIADFTVGICKDLDSCGPVPPGEAHLVSVESRKGGRLGTKSLRQCVAQAAALYELGKKAGKPDCSVRAILTNASEWIFIRIDARGHLWRSKQFEMDIRTFKERQVLQIYQVVYHLVKSGWDSVVKIPAT